MQVVAGGMQTEQLNVHHVRHPRQGMPVRLGRRCKCPFYVRPSQSFLYYKVLGHIAWVIVIDKAILQRPSIQPTRYNTEQQHAG